MSRTPGAVPATARVVCGVDGSVGSARALAWALREAVTRRAALHVVTAWVWDGVVGVGTRDAGRRTAQAQDALLRAVVARYPGPLPEIRTVVRQGDAATVLLAESAGALLLVLGSHGADAPRAQELGSVADTCLRHGPCPVVVVPSASPVDRVRPGGAGERTVLLTSPCPPQPPPRPPLTSGLSWQN